MLVYIYIYIIVIIDIQQINVSAVNFCEYPFTFDAEAKTEILQVEAIMQMQVCYMTHLFF